MISETESKAGHDEPSARIETVDEAPETLEDGDLSESLLEDVSIDGMCGVY